MKLEIFLAIFVFSMHTAMKGQALDSPEIRWIAINNSNDSVKIRWEKSTSAINYYIVKYYAFSGVNNPQKSWLEVPGISIGAAAEPFVSISTSLLEGVDVTAAPVAFAIEAHAGAGVLPSDVDGLPWDSSICLKMNFDTCLARVQLYWNSYSFNMVPGATAEYQIFLSVNGGAYSLLDRLPPSDTSYTNTSLIANNIYTIYVSAVSEGYPGDSATSNIVTIDTRMARLPDYIYADYATYYSDNAALQFSIDPACQIVTYNLLRSSASTGPYDSICQLTSKDNKINYVDKIDYAAGPYFYKVDAINYCHQAIRTSENAASTIVLQNVGTNTEPELQWNDYYNWANGIQSYNLERKFGNDSYTTLNQSYGTAFTDASIAGLTEQGFDADVCYRVTALELDNPYGEDNTSVSNEVCFELPLNIRFEYDAFIPGSSDNNEFGPVIDFIPDEFNFEILDRNGRIVHQSENPEDCNWDGKINGLLAPEGAYMYVLQYRSGNNKKHVLRGGVAVVYPQ